MEFDYYTDEIKLDNVNYILAFEELDNFANSIKGILHSLGYNNPKMNFFYKRNDKNESVLGIQLNNGDKTDITNYLVYECSPSVLGKTLLCNINVHADSKISRRASILVPMISKNVKDFFNSMELSIINNKRLVKEFDIMKEEDIEKKKEKLLSRIFKK